MSAQSVEAGKAPTRRPRIVLVSKESLVRTEATPFLLHDGDFLRLTKLHSFVSIWAHTFFAGTGLFFVTLCAKWVDTRYYGGQYGITSFDWITLTILTFLAVIFELLHLFWPSERKKTIKKIRAHFSSQVVEPSRSPRRAG
jgi:hypothetical protein